MPARPGPRRSGVRREPASILRSAVASESGSPVSRAAQASAWYSRERLTALRTRIAASGPSSTAPISPAQALVVLAAVVQAGQQPQQAGRPGHHRGQRPGDRGDQHVAVVDVRQLVGDHRAQLVLVQGAQQAHRAAHGGGARVPAGGEGVRRLGRRDVDPRHRAARLVGKLAHDLVEHRGAGLADRLRVHRPQREGVRAVVRVARGRRAARPSPARGPRARRAGRPRRARERRTPRSAPRSSPVPT